MLRELEGHNESPVRDIYSKHKGRRDKRPLPKPRSSSRSAVRRSQLLHEIGDYNKSPEAEDRHGLAMARELEDGLRHIPLTRGSTIFNVTVVARRESKDAEEGEVDLCEPSRDLETLSTSAHSMRHVHSFASKQRRFEPSVSPYLFKTKQKTKT